jgi:diguanylate cyclase (GGDEF)-like protein
VTDNLAKTQDGLWPLLERLYEGALLIDSHSWCVIRANPAAAEMLGSTTETIVGLSVVDFFDEPSREIASHQLKLGLVGEASRNPVLARLAAVKGRERLVGFRIIPLTLDGSKVLGALMEWTHQSTDLWLRIDPVTYLPDRVLLEAKLTSLLRRCPTESQFAILFVDLDNFKAVNDELGHVVGDSALRDAAELLRQAVGKGGVLVRYGGDEFAVLVEDLVDTRTVEEMVSRIRSAFAKPIAIPGGEVQLNASVGVATGPADYRSPADVIAAADRAMYAAKRGK